jgi:poly-gamma-glutamate synthesis protein (capsule biosynthesis protein)
VSELWAALAALFLVLGACQPGQNHTATADPPETAFAASSTPAPSVTLALLGDVMLGREVHPTAETFAYLEPFLSSADLALANLESPLTTAPVQTASPYPLCAPPERVSFLVEAGFDLLALANNHNLDCGPDGLLETRRTLTDAGLGFIGPGPQPIYLSVNGMRLAFLAFDAVSGLDVDASRRAVQSAHDTGAIVVVSVHWGLEYQSGAAASQRRIARALTDGGATVIWGHHPHVLQPAETIDNSRALVLYSLGNALFDQHGLESTRRSALVLVTLDSNGVEGFNVIPFLIDIRNSRVLQAAEEDAPLIKQYFR